MRFYASQFLRVLDIFCRSEVDDINLGLEHFYGDFNVVHCQLISSGVSCSPLPIHRKTVFVYYQIRDYHSLINHISHVLRPGGLVDLTEFPFSFTGFDRQPVLPPAGSFQPPWTPLLMSYINRAVRARGGDADASTHLHEWVSNHPAFEDVVYREFWIPCSPWMTGNNPVTKFWNEIGSTMRDDIKVSNICYRIIGLHCFCRHSSGLHGHSYLAMASKRDLSTLWNKMQTKSSTRQ